MVKPDDEIEDVESWLEALRQRLDERGDQSSGASADDIWEFAARELPEDRRAIVWRQIIGHSASLEELARALTAMRDPDAGEADEGPPRAGS